MVRPGSPPQPPETGPAWGIARLFPDQGQFSVRDYLQLTSGINKPVEFTDGHIEVLPMPKTSHQKILAFVYALMLSFVESNQLGTVLFAPLRVQLRPGKFREPDLVFMLRENESRAREDFWEGADLVMEIVSDDDPDRDIVQKRVEYAEAGIPEYWIIDPRIGQIEVLRLDGDKYVSAVKSLAGEEVSSVLLPKFSVDVSAVFKAGRSLQ
jgi:Uma2 family endonuclease